MEIPLTPARLKEVKDGIKTCTFRSGIRNYTLGKAFLYNSEDKSDRLQVSITSLEVKSFGNISSDDLRGHGHSSLSDFRASMLQIYPDLEDATPVTIVRFAKD